MEENQVTYHSDTSAETSYESQETTAEPSYDSAESDTPVTTQDAPTEPPKGFKVKYNKEERFVTEDEAPTWIQKGLNYDKVAEKATKAEQYQQALERQARIAGFRDVTEYMEALDAYERQQEVERQASKMGVDPEVYEQYFAPVSQEVKELRDKLSKFEQQEQQRAETERNQSLWKSLYDAYPTLLESANAFTEGKNPEWYNDSMQQYISRGYEPVHAYELAHKDTLFLQKEQEVLARVTGRDAKQILPSNDRPNNVQFSPENMSTEQILEISRRVQRGERITF